MGSSNYQHLTMSLMTNLSVSLFRMFVDSCKRLRVMKGSDAMELGKSLIHLYINFKGSLES